MRTPWLTPEGMERLKEELEHLWRVERPEVTRKVSWAASLGDRSENADYHYNKKRLREIDRRLLYLRKCIDNFKVIEYHPHQEGKVMFPLEVVSESIPSKTAYFSSEPRKLQVAFPEYRVFFYNGTGKTSEVDLFAYLTQ